MSRPDRIQKVALDITRAVGSPASIFLHTVLFVASFAASWAGLIAFDRMLLVLTTIVSLEAIYLAIFIQMTINFQGQIIAAVEQDIDEIQEDVEEISEDVDEIQKDVDEIQEDVDVIQEGMEEIGEDVEGIEKSDAQDEHRKSEQRHTLQTIETTLRKLAEDIERLKD